jgi:hypothetical protein
LGSVLKVPQKERGHGKQLGATNNQLNIEP